MSDEIFFVQLRLANSQRKWLQRDAIVAEVPLARLLERRAGGIPGVCRVCDRSECAWSDGSTTLCRLCSTHLETLPLALAKPPEANA